MTPEQQAIVNSLRDDLSRFRDCTFRLRRRPANTRHLTADKIDQIVGDMHHKLGRLSEGDGDARTN